MPTRTPWIGLAAWMLAAVQCQAADVTAIVGATVVHPDRDLPSAVAPNSTVIIAGSRIEAIGAASSTPVPAGAKRIDGKGKWVVPGLIDSHVHFFQSGNLYTRPDVADFNAWMPYAKEVERNKARLPATFKLWLASGVTSVVDIGGPFWNFEMRDAAAASRAAPRVAVAGPLISMVDRVKLDLGDPPIIRIASADAARALVRRELERKPDFIKVWFIHQKGQDLAQSRRGFSGALGRGRAGGRGIPRPGEKEPRTLLPDPLRHPGLPVCAVEYLAADRSRAAPRRSADPR